MTDHSTYPTLPDVIEGARSALSPAVWDWIEGGTSGEQSLTANRAMFDRWFFVPDVLTGAPPVDLTTDFFGVRTAMPIFAAPFGSDGRMHPDGYLGAARALAASDNTSIVSETSTDSFVDIGSTLGEMRGMVQKTLLGSDDHVLDFAERVASAGFKALCFTSSPAEHWRERIHRWSDELELQKFSGIGNRAAGIANPGDLKRDASQPRWNWERLAAISDRLALPWIYKGVNSAEVARLALAAGASGVYISNFGGRNVDGMLPTLEVLPEVVAEVDGRVPVLIDSGFRRGTDVVKALALGASAVGFGRLTAFSLAADGERSVARMLELLHGEITAVIGALGVSRPSELGMRHLRRLPV